jgi:hypothetical protein
MSKKYPLLDDKEWLYQKYWVEDLSGPQIAGIVECSYGGVWHALRRLNIEGRTKSEAVKDKKNPMFGKSPSEKTRAKLRKARKNKKPMLGKRHTEKTKEKMAEAHKGEKNHNYGKHFSEETRRKLREARKHQIFPTSYTKIECIFWDISKKNNIPSEYTGDSKIWIGRVNPDFIIRDKKIAIFVNGDYWHSPLLRPTLTYTQRVEVQIKECKRHKWKAVIIWGTDLLREDAEAFVLSVLK